MKRSAPFLPAGSDIRYVFICLAAAHFWIVVITYVTGLTIWWITFRCVAITPDAIYVLDSSRTSGGAKPRSFLGTMPRHTRLGPVSGRWAEITLFGERHRVHQRFHAGITAADTEAGFTDPG